MMQRHRNPANGYRSSPIGIGGGGAGGGAMAAGGPGYRSYSRGGFGRGQPPPPRRTDVFMEAGKLAAEYLISKGLIPPNSVNGRWQNSNLKNQITGGVGGGDGVSDTVSGTGSGRRRFPDDYSGAIASRDGIRAKRTLGSLKNPAVELNREVNQSLVSEKVKSSSEKQGDGESYSGSMEEQKNGKDGGGEDRKSVSGDLDSKSYDAGNLDTSITNQQNDSPAENAGIKTPISDERNDGLKNINASTDDFMDDGKQEPEKPIVKEDPPAEDDNKVLNNNTSDLLTLIRINKIPTRTRSSVTLKGSKSDPVLISEDENQNKQDGENQALNHEPQLKIEQVPPEDDHKYEFGQGLHTRSLSFPQRSSISDQEFIEGHHGITRSSSALLSIGEKRPLEVNDISESSKKPRDMDSANPQTDDYMHASSSRDQSSSQEGTHGITQSCNSYAEEKQFFPSSSKMCDLNSMEASTVHDNNNNHDTNSVIGFSSVGQAKQEPVSVDFDLTMNTSCDITDRNVKGVEVIDLDCDSMQDDDDNDNNNNNSDRREEAIYTDLESFPDSMRRVSDMPQDSYGLIISEFIDADIPNSSVSTSVNPMHNELSLPNEDGMLADDESIYMSLGEIPISFVPVWDQQPSQGYDKRY